MTIALLLIGGLLLMVLGGELLVRGAVKVAERLGVSPLLIGLTLVGFGTSTPELVTSVQAALIDQPGIAVGNIVGSNIANILLILGLSAMIYPVSVQMNALKRDGMLVVGTAVLMAAAGLTVGLNLVVGVAFIAMLAAYVIYAYRQEQTVEAKAGDHTAAFEKGEALQQLDAGVRPGAGGNLILSLLMAVAGLALVIFGGRYFVDGAVQLAQLLGMSETVIGLTIVAVGTSMPEFVTSVLAAFRKQADVALGNILGSNIYNILGIGGVTALIAPMPGSEFPAQIANFDNWVMIAVSVLLLIFLRTGFKLSRLEGGVFVLLYAGYVTYLISTVG